MADFLCFCWTTTSNNQPIKSVITYGISKIIICHVHEFVNVDDMIRICHVHEFVNIDDMIESYATFMNLLIYTTW